MKKIIAILIGIMSMTTLMAKPSKSVTLRIVETTDVHGAFFPYDFTERRPMSGTMARVSSYVKRQRKEMGDRLILLDNGDILQGQPTCYYTNFVATDKPNIAAEVLNYMQYDAEAFGNHDVEVGHKVYDKWIKELACPTLGANIIDEKAQQPYVQPYLIIEREGVRIAILGMLTPAIPNWLHQSLWSGLRFEEILQASRRWVKILREQEKADVVIGLYHSGWDGGIVTPDYNEDVAQMVAEQIEGMDILLFGHDHREFCQTVNGMLCLNAAANAKKVAQATITLKKTKKGWTIAKKQGDLIDVTEEAIDQDFMQHFQPQVDAIKAFVNRQIGAFSETMYSRDAFFGSAAFVDLIHDLQLEHTKADISFTAPLIFNSEIKAGPVYMSDMFKLYRFENGIYVLRMTGKEIRQHLELSYDQWVNTMTSPDDHIMLLAPKAPGDNQREGFKNFTFNFDSAAGIDYVVDVTKPDGQKVQILQFSDGRPFSEDAWYRVAMNSYRGNGGGELLVRGAGIPWDSIPQRIEYMSERDQRYYLTQKIEREGTITPRALNNWRFVPDAWAKPAIERDREALFGR
ncbi:MAG: 5'-nucleotidase C-terminal domain-containing protein [Paludibacteraceae bacterium]|nr:5'-nucleotidase C-terminal domain-containing protein [Paludibacteraceae bacterium]